MALGDADDIVAGCVRYLSAISAVTAVLGADSGGPWIFQRQMAKVVEGTSSQALLVTRQGGWAGPNQHNTLAFPRISLEFWVDPRRDSAKNVIEPAETERRADAVFKVVDRFMHRPQGGVVAWGSIRTVGCHRLGEFVSYEVPDGDGLLRAQVFYAVQEG